MATDIQISELNEITVNSDINHIIVNDRESLGDPGITKKIKLENLLTSNIIGEANLSANAVTSEKIKPLTIDCSRLTCKTITCHQITDRTICNNLIGTNTIDNRVINNDCGFSVKCLTVCDGPVSITSGVNGCLAVESGITKLNTLRYFWPQQQIANTFLHTDGNGNLSWQEAVPGESTSLVFREIFPVGTIIPWAGNGTTPDGSKWLPCNGGSFSNIDWPDLATALGDTWGTHNGNTYFLPDLRGRVPMGSGTSSDTNGTSCSFTAPQPGGNNYGGVYSHKLTSTESGMPSHRHQLGIPRDSYGANADQYALYHTAGNDEQTKFEHFSDYQSADAANYHENIQPYTKVRYIIKAAKDDVQQFNPTVGPGLSAKDANGQTNTLTLTSTEIGIKIDNETLQFDGSNNITLNPVLTATSVTFDGGSVQTGAGIGYGQTWKLSPASGNILQTPNWGSYFTNTTGRPIQLSFTAWRAGQDNIAVSIDVDGYVWDVLQATNSGGGVMGSSTVIIPAGATYRFQSIGDPLTSFTVHELS